jgi:hypothetical protein
MNRITVRASIVSLTAFVALARPALAQSQVDWSQPPVSCVEEAVPDVPNKTCLDLAQVSDPMKDFPPLLPAVELHYWQANKSALNYCRAMEVLHREEAMPGSQRPAIVETSWMQEIAVAHRLEKIKSVYQASRDNSLPAQVLTGALYQESMFSELGVAEDGGNYSCGVGQVNIAEWCRWANDQTPVKKTSLEWPQSGFDCASIPPAILKPFYEIALTRLHGVPEYRMESSYFDGIKFSDVVSGFPTGSESTQAIRFQTAVSFISHCSNASNGIAAKAHELASLYRDVIPEGIKNINVYPVGEQYKRSCMDHGYEGVYPLSMAWLLAVGTYNAGPRAVDALAYYNQWTADDMRNSETFQDLTIPDIVSSLYWSGKYQANDDKIHFSRLDGSPASWLWFKPCVLQRHIARVVQHVTLPDSPDLADSLEGAFHCAKSVFDPATGTLLQSAVPHERQQSSGRKYNLN